jgi:hypothetical protein
MRSGASISFSRAGLIGSGLELDRQLTSTVHARHAGMLLINMWYVCSTNFVLGLLVHLIQ